MMDLSRAAGAAIMRHFDPLGVTDAVKKADESPVTRMDKAAYELIHREVRLLVPDPAALALWSEEQTAEDIARERHPNALYRLIVDEVDGTVAAENGVPVFTHLQALVHAGQVIQAVIHDPFQDISYYANWNAAGSHVVMYKSAINRPGLFDPQHVHGTLSVRPMAKLGGKVRVGVVTWPGCPFNMQEVYAELERRNCIAIDMCSIGYIDARVACGQYAGVIFPGNNTFHDHAAGDFLVRMAGGVFTDIHGREIRYDGDFPQGHIAACSPEVHAELLDIVRVANGW